MIRTADTQELDVLVERWLAIRQIRSTYRSRRRANSVASELCNLASRFRKPCSTHGVLRFSAGPRHSQAESCREVIRVS
jgi:hypothetical protein